MRRSTRGAHHLSVLALATAALVALTGCSTAISGTATAATRLASTEGSASTTESTSSQAPGSGAGETTTTDPIRPMPPMPSITRGSGDNGGSGARTLDGASINWLTEFCVGFADVASYAGPNTDGLSDEEIVQEVAGVYDAMSTAASHAEEELQSLAEPTFPGQQRIVPAALEWFHAVTTVYGHGAQAIATTTFHSLEELSAAIDEVEAGMDSANARFGKAIGDVDPSVTDAMRKLPECSALVDSEG